MRPRLLAAGYSDDELRRMRSQRRLVAVRPGAYVLGDDERLRNPETRHALAVHAAVPHLGPGAVVSHMSAAVLHGMPLWGAPLDRVHVTRPRRSGARRSRHLHVHAAALDADEVVAVDGIAVTSVARTVADLARSLAFEAALVPADGALFLRLADPAALVEAVGRSSSRPGNTAARRVVAFADGGAQSPGESRSRVAMMRAGLPAPILQRHVLSRVGQWIGKVDFDWPGLATVGEFDGEVKYGRLLRPGQEPGEVVFAEKLREDAIRDQGLRVVRWVWADLTDFGAVAARLRHAFGRS